RAYTCTCAMHAHSHTQTHTHTHKRARTRVHTHTRACTHTHVHTHTHTHTHTHLHPKASLAWPPPLITTGRKVKLERSFPTSLHSVSHVMTPPVSMPTPFWS